MRSSVVALVAVLVACGDAPQAKVEAHTPIFAAPEPAAGDSTCTPTGLWARCSVFYRLVQAGLAVHRDSAVSVREKPLSIEGFELPIARGRIRVFLYADSASRISDQAKLDMKEFVTPARNPGFAQERTLLGSANLLVLMDVRGETNRDRIANNLMAGAPQPPSHKP